jgi:hypothetical protein
MENTVGVVVLVTGSRDLPANGVVEKSIQQLHDELIGVCESKTFTMYIDTDKNQYGFKKKGTLTIDAMLHTEKKEESKKDDFVKDPKRITLVHGNARGADTYAKQFARKLGWSVIDCEPDWRTLGKRAGLTRNATMVNDYQPHFVLAFPMRRGTEKISKGTEHCIQCVRKYKQKGRLVDLRISYTDA